MGQYYMFACPTCQYQSSHLSGGHGGTQLYVSQTVHCLDCRELKEIRQKRPSLLGHLLNPFGKRPEKPLRLACPESAQHQVQEFHHPGACPKCGCSLERSDSVLDVD